LKFPILSLSLLLFNVFKIDSLIFILLTFILQELLAPVYRLTVKAVLLATTGRIHSFIMIIKLASVLGFTAIVLAQTQACCPNGVYTDDPALACNNPDVANYGDLMCYGQYEIDCTGSRGASNPIKETQQTSHSIISCIQFCEDFAPGFATANLLGVTNPGEIPTCTCFGISGPLTANSDAFSANLCPSG
jgi:hypothetical protein